MTARPLRTVDPPRALPGTLSPIKAVVKSAAPVAELVVTTAGFPAAKPVASASGASADHVTPKSPKVDLAGPTPKTAEVRGHIDWQGHPAMHIPYPFFRKGLTDRKPKRTSWKHQLRQVMSKMALDASGVRIHLMAAIAAERARTPKQARRLILKQLRYVEDFVAKNSDHYAIAKTPEEARRLLATTNKQVIVHSIEGGRKILNGPEDAKFWREQGVALITVVHLLDDELGGSANEPGNFPGLINPKGVRRAKRGEDRGLTERGKAALVELADEGILVDLTHMSPDAVRDALEVTRANGIPPIVTHGKLCCIRDTERGFTDEQILEIYRQGGVFNLVLNGASLDPVNPTVELPKDTMWGTIDSFQFHYETLRMILEDNLETLFGPGVKTLEDLTEEQRTLLATGWASDWNGFTSHSKPKFGGKDGRPLSEIKGASLPIDTLGLADPSFLPQHWQRLKEAGVDLDPMERSSERFLQIWEQMEARRKAKCRA